MEAKVSAPAPLRLRPLEIGDLLDETFRIYRRHFLLFAGISVILAIPSAGLQGYSFFAIFNYLFSSSNAGQLPPCERRRRAARRVAPILRDPRLCPPHRAHGNLGMPPAALDMDLGGLG